MLAKKKTAANVQICANITHKDEFRDKMCFNLKGINSCFTIPQIRAIIVTSTFRSEISQDFNSFMLTFSLFFFCKTQSKNNPHFVM